MDTTVSGNYHEREIAKRDKRIAELETALQKVLDHDLDDPRFKYDPNDLRMVIQSMRHFAKRTLDETEKR